MKKFTLVELLVVIAIISILMTSMMVGGSFVINRARKTKALGTMSKLQVAIQSYKGEYKKLPMIADGQLKTNGVLIPKKADLLNDESEYRKTLLILANRLKNKDDRKTYNPRNKAFWEPPQEFDEEGLVDPWGNPFVLWFDHDVDGYAGAERRSSGTSTDEGTSASGAVHIFSWGPDYEGVKQLPTTLKTTTHNIISTISKS